MWDAQKEPGEIVARWNQSGQSWVAVRFWDDPDHTTATEYNETLAFDLDDHELTNEDRDALLIGQAIDTRWTQKGW